MSFKPLFLVFFLLTCLLLGSCGAAGGGNGPEGTSADAPGSQSGGDEPAAEPVLHPDQAPVELHTGDSKLTVSVSDGKVILSALSTTASGKNYSDGAVAVPLPYGCKAVGKRGVTSEPGYDVFDWRYVGCKKSPVEAGTYSQTGIDLLFEDSATKSNYTIRITAHQDFAGPFELTGYYQNGSGKRICLNPGNYFAFSSKGSSSPTAWSFKKESGLAEGWTIYSGQSAKGTGIYQTVMDPGVTFSVLCNTNQNWNAGGDIPILYVDYPSDGGGVYYALEWVEGGFDALGSDSGACAVTGHIGETSFMTAVESGDTFTLPTIYFGVYDGDVDDGSNVFKRWYLYNKAPARMVEVENEPWIQEDMQIGLDAADYGIEQIKWDYGWWSNEHVSGAPLGQAVTNEGYNKVRSEAYLGVLRNYGVETLSEFTALAKERGLALTLYFLTKDTHMDEEGIPTSEGEFGHPEWFSNRKIVVGESTDFGNAECAEFYKTYLLSFFRDNGVTTWRSDFEPICYTSDKENRHFANGVDVSYWCAVGFFDVVDYLYDNYEDFRYETCCSGGAMKDYATMRRAVYINNDDSADYMSLRMTFYDTSYCLPTAQIQLPTNAGTYDDPNSPFRTGTADGVAGIRTQLLGAVMLSNWTGPTELDKQLWETYLPYYKNDIRPLIREGNLYHILPRPDGVHWDGLQYIDLNSERENIGLVCLWKPTNEEGNTKVIKLRGLSEEDTYQLVFHDRPEQNMVKTGKELMEEGFPVTMEEESASEWVWIRRG